MATAGALLPQTASSFRFAVETSEHDDGLAAFCPSAAASVWHCLQHARKCGRSGGHCARGLVAMAVC